MGSKQQQMSNMAVLRSDSCHSSYDNLEIHAADVPPDIDDLERCVEEAQRQGVDPSVLAAQLEDIKERMSPGASPNSSQPEMYVTPTMSSPASSPTRESPSPSAEMPPAPSATKSKLSLQSPIQKEDLGEIQLQLSYDDYDGTLNIHVIEARNLRPRDKNGFSDPFVKVHLLPGRKVFMGTSSNAENKRRTKYIPRTLDPQWHQTLVFMGIPRDELRNRKLEITVWDFDRFKPNDFLGQIVFDLADETVLDNKAHWYKLQDHTPSSTVAATSGMGAITSTDSSSGPQSEHATPTKQPLGQQQHSQQHGQQHSQQQPMNQQPNQHHNQQQHHNQHAPHQHPQQHQQPHQQQPPHQQHQHTKQPPYLPAHQQTHQQQQLHQQQPKYQPPQFQVQQPFQQHPPQQPPPQQQQLAQQPQQPVLQQQQQFQQQPTQQPIHQQPQQQQPQFQQQPHYPQQSQQPTQFQLPPQYHAHPFQHAQPQQQPPQQPPTHQRHQSSSQIQDVALGQTQVAGQGPAVHQSPVHQVAVPSPSTSLSPHGSTSSSMSARSRGQASSGQSGASDVTARAEPDRSVSPSPKHKASTSNLSTSSHGGATSASKYSPGLGRRKSVGSSDSDKNFVERMTDTISGLFGPTLSGLKRRLTPEETSSTRSSPIPRYTRDLDSPLSEKSCDKEKPKPLSSLEDSPLLLVNHGYDFTFHLNGYEPYDTTGSGNDVRESRDTAGPYTPSTSHTSRSFNYAFDNIWSQSFSVPSTPLSVASTCPYRNFFQSDYICQRSSIPVIGWQFFSLDYGCEAREDLGPGQVLPNQVGLKVKHRHKRCYTVGIIQVGLQCDAEDDTLTVSVMQCHVNTKRKSQQLEWIVTVRHWEARNSKKPRRRSSKVQRACSNPQFNQLFTFDIQSLGGLLELCLWSNSGIFGLRRKAGTALISLDKVNFEAFPNYEVTTWYKLLYSA